MDALTLARATADEYWRSRLGTDTYYPASAGTETRTRHAGGDFTYVYNPDTRTHGYLCHAHDVVYTDTTRAQCAPYKRA